MMRIKTLLLLALVVASFTVSMVQAQEPLIPLPDAKDLLPSIILTAGDGADDDQYGYSIAVDGTTAIIGAPYHDAKGYENSGAVYIYDYVGSSWQFKQKIVKTPHPQSNSHFGWDVDISIITTVKSSSFRNRTGYGRLLTIKSISDTNPDLELRLRLKVHLSRLAHLLARTAPRIRVLSVSMT
jgi:hypothetical protein